MGKRLLWSGNSDIGEGRSDVCEQVGEIIPERLCTSGNCESNEDYQHCVFSGGRTTFVTAEATNQSKHLKILLQSAGPWPVGAKGDHNRHSAGDLITVFQSEQRTSRRQKIAFSQIFIRLCGKCSAFGPSAPQATVLLIILSLLARLDAGNGQSWENTDCE